MVCLLSKDLMFFFQNQLHHDVCVEDLDKKFEIYETKQKNN
jgi:hypothetical protein